MQVLLTNDDGIDAPGLNASAEVVELAFAKRVRRTPVVAPAGAMSMVGHRVTTDDPLSITELGSDRVAVRGTPADCVRIAIAGLELRPDLVVSGINFGGNLGHDIHVSGTVAAAREAAALGVPAVAISHYLKSGMEVDWAFATALAARAIEELGDQVFDAAAGFWNINLPHLPPGTSAGEVECVICLPSKEPLPVEFRREGDQFHYTGVYSSRAHEPDTDVAHCFGGRVALSWVGL